MFGFDLTLSVLLQHKEYCFWLAEPFIVWWILVASVGLSYLVRSEYIVSWKMWSGFCCMKFLKPESFRKTLKAKGCDAWAKWDLQTKLPKGELEQGCAEGRQGRRCWTQQRWRCWVSCRIFRWQSPLEGWLKGTAAPLSLAATSFVSLSPAPPPAAAICSILMIMSAF